MGINLKKKMGWFVNCKSSDLSNLQDLLIEDPKLKKILPYEDACKIEDFDIPESSYNKISLCDVFKIYTNDSEKVEGVIITPPEYIKEWNRFSDDIDMQEEKEREGKSRLKEISGQLFPYNRPYIVKRTGLELSHRESRLVYNGPSAYYSKDEIEQAKKLGIDTNQNKWDKQLFTKGPEILFELCKLVKIESKNYKYMYPVVATIWD